MLATAKELQLGRRQQAFEEGTSSGCYAYGAANGDGFAGVAWFGARGDMESYDALLEKDDAYRLFGCGELPPPPCARARRSARITPVPVCAHNLLHV